MGCRVTGACAILTAIAVCGGSTAVRAQSISEIDPLHFGVVLISNNADFSNLTLDTNGDLTATGDVIVVAEGTAGRYQATGFDPDQELAIELSAEPLFPDGGNANRYFTLSGLTPNPATITTDGAGAATFTLGATLVTSGNGWTYLADDYSAEITITLTPP